MSQEPYKHTERGNALVYVFIGVALFGALMFLFSKGASQNTSGFTKQQSSISASELIEMGKTLESGVQKIMNNGCSENEISFDPPPYTANSNSNSPVDFHCHVFHPKGGNVNSQFFGNWKFSSHASIETAGSDNTEIVGYIEGLSADTCQKINDLLQNGFATIPLESGYVFNGSFDGTSPTNTGAVRWIGVSTSATNNKTSGCINSDTHTPYIYYHAVLVR